MSNRIVAIDLSGIAHAAFHSTGLLTHEGQGTGVIFGVMKKIDSLRNALLGDYVICCDSRESVREQIYPEYKANRSNRRADLTREEMLARASFHNQVSLLRNEIFIQSGFQVEYQEGYEADDLIASVVKHNRKPEIIIVSGDEDMFQLLSDRVSIWSPSKSAMTSLESFTKAWNLPPSDWAKVKAIAGCSSDNIKGVPKVGNITAAKWQRGILKGKLADAIANSWPLIKSNYRLVKLPFEGTKEIIVKPQQFNQVGWDAMATKYGMQSLVAGVKQRTKKAGK